MEDYYLSAAHVKPFKQGIIMRNHQYRVLLGASRFSNSAE